MSETIPSAHLQASNLCWQAAAAHIVRDVSLHVAQGELVGLLGPNGSGKSTLLRMIYRILKPASGSVEVSGSDVWRSSARDNARAMALYTQAGFTEYGRNPRGFRSRTAGYQELVYMRLEM